MRLLNTSSLELESFTHDVPSYAILSHTWGTDEEEVNFQEITAEVRTRKTTSKSGYVKIVETCRIARRKHELQYAWIDTCCIDKTSSVELSEAINSMYKWYQEAEICFAYLADVDTEESFFTSRWWGRGWTLQELIAPDAVHFYDKHWVFKGTKISPNLTEGISKVTAIPYAVLVHPKLITLHSVSERMMWASSRKTTREEDLAYCLLGIFDINLPLLYGEGSKAFFRLQEEIINQYDDMTIFAWESDTDYWPYSSILAESPAAFKSVNPNLVQKMDIILHSRRFSVTNRGVKFRSVIAMDKPTGCSFLPLFRTARLSDNPGVVRLVGIHMRQISRDLFVRAFPYKLFILYIPAGAPYNKLHTVVFHTPRCLQTEQLIALRYKTLRFVIPGSEGPQILEAEPRSCYDPDRQAVHAGHLWNFLGYIKLALPISHPQSEEVGSLVVVMLCIDNEWFAILVKGHEWYSTRESFYQRFRDGAAFPEKCLEPWEDQKFPPQRLEFQHGGFHTLVKTTVSLTLSHIGPGGYRNDPSLSGGHDSAFAYLDISTETLDV